MREDGDVPTAGVDKNGNLYYNPEWIGKIPQDQVKTVVAHEVMHVALEHLLRLKNKQPKVWNMAADTIVNNLLSREGFVEVDDTIWPKYNKVRLPFSQEEITIEEIDKKSVEEVYDLVYSKIPEKEVTEISYGSGDGGNGDEQKMPTGFDKHFDPEEAKENKRFSKKDKETTKEAWNRALSEAANYAKQRGKLPGGIERKIDDVFGSRTNWKDLLYRYVTNLIPSDYTYMKPSKKSRVVGTYLPSVKREGLDCVVAVDTSGSIRNEELSEFLGEINQIKNSFAGVDMTILSVDTDVNSVKRVRRGRRITPDQIEFKGGGGTDMRKVAEWVKKNEPNTDLVITMTDGYTPFPKNNKWKQFYVLCKNSVPESDVPRHLNPKKIT